jgi:hypothetical protein
VARGERGQLARLVALTANGLSITTWQPAASAAVASGACVWCGVETTTRSSAGAIVNS